MKKSTVTTPRDSQVCIRAFLEHRHTASQNPTQESPIIIWLQGGPGGSSQFGAFTELGPIRITNRTFQSPYDWNILGHNIFFKQLLTVGFSYVKNKDIPLASSVDQAADHLINFLYNLYKQWPALGRFLFISLGNPLPDIIFPPLEANS